MGDGDHDQDDEQPEPVARSTSAAGSGTRVKEQHASEASIVVKGWWQGELSASGQVSHLVLQQPEQLAGDGAGEAAADLTLALALGGAAGGVDLGRLVVAWRIITMVCNARLSWRSPPRFSRWRTTWPEEASTGAAPASIAKAASERNRPGCDQLMSTWAALIGPIPRWASSTGAMAVISWRSSASSALASPCGQHPLGGHAQRPHGGAVLHRSRARPPAPRRPEPAAARCVLAGCPAAAQGR